MSKPKRFRDMSLTEDEVEALIHANADLCERKMSWSVDPFGVGEELDNTELVVFIDRAKRLLPLWRKLGLQELYNQGHCAACEGYEWPAWKEGKL